MWHPEFFRRCGIRILAVGSYLLFLVAIAVSAWFIVTGLGEYTTTKTQEKTVGGAITEIVVTDETTRSIPITALLALLGAGGVGGAIILPLRFLWDEMANRAQNKRQVASATRERLHVYIEKYYVPMAYALDDLATECGKWAAEISSRRPNKIVFDRWLYSVARVWQIRRDMRHRGGSWFFQSHIGEDDVYRAFWYLESALDDLCEQTGVERSLLASGLEDLQPRDFISFRARLAPLGWKSWWTQDPWKELRHYRKCLLAKCRSPNAAHDFQEVRTAAAHTAMLIQFHGTAIYAPWYHDMPLRGDLERVKEAQKWVRRCCKKECASGDRGGTGSTQVGCQSGR